MVWEMAALFCGTETGVANLALMVDAGVVVVEVACGMFLAESEFILDKRGFGVGGTELAAAAGAGGMAIGVETSAAVADDDSTAAMATRGGS